MLPGLSQSPSTRINLDTAGQAPADLFAALLESAGLAANPSSVPGNQSRQPLDPRGEAAQMSLGDLSLAGPVSELDGTDETGGNLAVGDASAAEPATRATGIESAESRAAVRNGRSLLVSNTAAQSVLGSETAEGDLSIDDSAKVDASDHAQDNPGFEGAETAQAGLSAQARAGIDPASISGGSATQAATSANTDGSDEAGGSADAGEGRAAPSSEHEAEAAPTDGAPNAVVPHPATVMGNPPPAVGLAIAAVAAPAIAAGVPVADTLPEAARLAVGRNVEKQLAPSSQTGSAQGEDEASSADPAGRPPAAPADGDGNGEVASNRFRHIAARLTANPDSDPPPPRPGDIAVKGGLEAAQNLGLTGSLSHSHVATGATATAASAAANGSAPPPVITVPLAGLAVAIAAQAHDGTHRFEIRLDPPELGRIDVRLDIDRDGQATTHLVVERADTLDLLKRDAAQLERALQQAGLKTSDNALEFSLRQQSLARDDSTPQQAPRVFVPENDPAPLEALRQGYGRLLGLGGGLDIRV